MRKYLYHGSGRRLKVLSPRTPVDGDGLEWCKKAVYAGFNKRFCLAIAAIRSGKNVSSFNNRKTNQQNIFEGWPDENATVYLYYLKREGFVHNRRGEWISKKKVVPVKVEEYKVKDLRHLYRRSNKVELKEWMKDREEWRAPNETLGVRIRNKLRNVRLWI